MQTKTHVVKVEPTGFSTLNVFVDDKEAGKIYSRVKHGEDVWRVSGVDLWFARQGDAIGFVLKQAAKKGLFS